MEALMNPETALLSFLGQPLPPLFKRRVVVLTPGDTYSYNDAEWQGAIVVVEQGQIELECLDGSRHSFEQGSILWLEKLPLRTLRNHGCTPAVLIAVSRKIF
jgi:hypothetical protein